MFSFFGRPFSSTSPYSSSLLCFSCRQQSIPHSLTATSTTFFNVDISLHSHTPCLAYLVPATPGQSLVSLIMPNCSNYHQVIPSPSNNNLNLCTASTNPTHILPKCTAKIPATSRSRPMMHKSRALGRHTGELSRHTRAVPAVEPVLLPVGTPSPAR